MNWGGIFVLAGVLYVAYVAWPWGALVFAVAGAALLVLMAPTRRRDRTPLPQAVTVMAESDAGSSFDASPSAQRRLPPLTSPPSAPQQVQRPARHRRPDGSKDGPHAEGHFARHATTPGWLYVFRNDLHAPNLYKIGYTTVGTAVRLRFMNEQLRGVSGAVGKFRVIYERRVPESFNAEQRVFARLAPFRARSNREFFQAPLEAIRSAIDAVADEATRMSVPRAQPSRSIDVRCPECGRTHHVDIGSAAHEIELCCPPCGCQWLEPIADAEETTATPDGDCMTAADSNDGHPLAARVAWSPPGMDPALAAVMVPRGELTEAQWWSALADRLTTMVLKEPDPEAAMREAATALEAPVPDSPEQAGETLLQHNLNLRTAMTLAVMARTDPFPVQVSLGNSAASEALQATDLETWLEMASSMVSGSSLD
ncbi:GIY-YIG nuclease family protein [Piscinibacter defluvii]|uniref:GIY-YIG nuclease family protein n=1 Tax=Piscinibacter defluvii TaxID=1796922 RepID=UPI000FDDDBA7|nr:GIY-YIG nuclease family protein [Piscinibacter defluvii]